MCRSPILFFIELIKMSEMIYKKTFENSIGILKIGLISFFSTYNSSNLSE